MSQRIRVYQLAKELGFSPKQFEQTVRSQGIDIKNYMSTLSAEQEQRVRGHVGARVESGDRPSGPSSVLRRARRQVEARETDSRSTAVESPPASAPQSRVIRDERGVIVGTRRRSEPKILGFIPVSRPRPKKRVEAVAPVKEARGRASRRKERERKGREIPRRRVTARRRGRRRGAPANTAAPRRPENREIQIDGTIRTGELAHWMGAKSSDVLKALWKLGLRQVTLNHSLDAETAALVAAQFGYRVEDVGFKEEHYLVVPREGGEARAPVVTVLGHVDHGKTTLLDRIRQTEVASNEAGGITQHLGAYRASTPAGDVVFLDTPGHAAFSAIRERGANVTDIVVLVVAADDGVMPTTVESIRAARAAEVPVVVALNKIDKPGANPGRVKQHLMEHGLIGEEFGGDTVICEVSALTGQGVDALLEAIALQAEVLELCAPAKGLAQARVLDARIDRGRGPVATVLVQSGELRCGAFVVAGEIRGKVRSMVDGHGRPVDVAGPSMVVAVSGLDDVLVAGQALVSVDDERIARQIVEHRVRTRRHTARRDNVVSIHDFLTRRNVPVLPVVLKTDHQASVEAIREAVEGLSTERVRAEVVAGGVGIVSESDVKLAVASGAVVLGFNVRVGPRASAMLAAEHIDAETHAVIYELLDDVRSKMIGLLEPERLEHSLGSAEVRALFRVPHVGVVAGCRVSDGTITRNSHARVIRAGEVVFDGRVGSLRIRKDDVSEVDRGRECGISLEDWDDLREGDEITAYELTEAAPSLG